MPDPTATLCGGQLAKLMPGKPDGPRVVLAALDALARAAGAMIAEAPTRPPCAVYRCPRQSEGRILASATTGMRGI